MTVLLVILALFAAVAGGAVAFFTAGTVGAVMVVLAVIAITGVALYLRGTLLKLASAATALIALGAIGFGGLSAMEIASGLGSFDGAADPADPAALASGQAKLDAAETQAGFRVALTDAELTAILQDSLADAAENPIRSVDLTVVDGEDGGQGVIEFEITFKNGSLSGSGRVGASLESGAINLQLEEVSLGRFTIPGLANGAVEEIVDRVLDLNQRLAEQRADVQSIEIGGGSVVVTGSQAGGSMVTATTLLDALAQNAAELGAAVTPPAEAVGPGTVNSTSADGASYVVALGDSLAANVGVSSASEGYVSRIHRVLSDRDGKSLGLRNFGISGETSGTLIRGGQLDEGLAFIRANEVAYIVVNIGANDLLGHLGSEDCADDIENAACQSRLDPALAAYRENLGRILEELRDAAGAGTPILFLQTYNPFSLGLGGLSLEAASNDATEQLNAVAAEVAAEHGVTVADGFTPMQGTTSTTTHMLDTPPDIHPNRTGYSLLAQALVDALP
ncbi:MAG: SGNH/GDSL hydrolase family protein [Dehalococcoidia bacterium]